jgi:hypothetical protein
MNDYIKYRSLSSFCWSYNACTNYKVIDTIFWPCFSQQIWGGMRPFHPLDSEMSLVYVLVVLYFWICIAFLLSFWNSIPDKFYSHLNSYQSTLKLLFQEFDSGSDAESQLAVVTTRIMQALQNNLDGKSKQYKDPALTYLFLMNNIHYMVRSVRRYAQFIFRVCIL